MSMAFSYWSLLKHLDDNAKMDLIILLTNSLKHSEKENEVSAKDFYGVWGDDGLTAEEFVNELKAERKFHREIIDL